MSGTGGGASERETTGPGGGTRIEVVAGGEPSPEELAALVIALTPVASPDDGSGEGELAAWHRAALLEGVGNAAPIYSAADLSGRRTRL